jgi:phosphoribosylaminoimidazole-succinocarboxamide synthase
MSIQPVLSPDEYRTVVDSIAFPAFRAIEEAWGKIETVQGAVVLADLKIEVGRRASDGRIVLADVVDNDSWRIWPGGDPRNQIDKQSFRDMESLDKVSDKYQLVAELTSQL